ncbi:MAG: recO [Verrucomicrobiales bacterium]|nr:recO [Verrucomicrobiales bacterium]
MAEERTTGLILRTRPLTETSLIVHWLTPALGRVATVAKGARRPTSPFRGKLDLFFMAEFSFVRSRRSELHNLREVKVSGTNMALRNDVGYLQQISYGVGLIETTTEVETPLENIFGLMVQLLVHLPKRPPEPLTVLGFEIKLLAELGLMPDLENSKLSPGSRQVFGKLLQLDWLGLNNLKLSGAQLLEIEQFLQAVIIFHFGKVPRGRQSALLLS